MHKTLLQLVISFEWDEGNFHKSWRKHNVSAQETEEVFANEPFMMIDDVQHSEQERRFRALGMTSAGRKLSVSFTIRNHVVRPISARTMSKKEIAIYVSRQN